MNMKKRLISLILSILMILAIIPPIPLTAQAADFETQLRNAGFSSSYIAPLLALHAKYPNWKFEALMVGEDFSTAVANERKHGNVSPGHNQQLIQQYSANDGKGYYCSCASCYKDGKYVVREKPNWISASESAVKYYLDPRNFLDEKYIFQFVSTEYNPPYTTNGVETILKGTWMYNANITYKDKNGNTVTYKNSSGNTVKYSQAIMDAAKDFKISAYYIAAKIVQEVGGATATAGGASGTYSGYPGIYNYYNINANSGAADGLKWASTNPEKCETKAEGRLRQGPSTSTAELVMLTKGTKLTYKSTTETQADGYKWIYVSVTYNGKSYTGYIREDLVDLVTNDYNRPWTNPYLSIYNGAKWIANNYGKQFTGYLQKFNVNPASSNMHDHEYMANVQGAASEGAKAYTAYKNANLLNSDITFTIPVFNNMPNDYPDGVKASVTNSGIEISWNQVPGAPMYRVFYKANGESSWHKAADTTDTSYTWTGAKAGTKYNFTVGCTSGENGTLTSSYDKTGASVTYVAKPEISSVSNDPTGVKISWGKVDGAEKYRVYYKTAGGSWTKITDTASASYTWTGAKSNTKYTFTARCVTSDGKAFTSGFDSAGKSILYIAAPELVSVSGSGSGITVSWNKVAGAQTYRLFYKANDESSWHAIAYTKDTSYTWKDAKPGTKYAFTVACTDGDGGALTSSYDKTGAILKYVDAPVLSSVSNTATGVTIKWNAVSGATKYKVFYKTGNGSWTGIATTTSTSYTWTGAKSNTKYTFTVRCVDNNGSYASGFDTVGKSVHYIAAPKLTSAIAGNTGTVISWEKVAGAEKYKVFRKTAGGSWVGIATTTSTSYTDKTAAKGTTYTYTVRCTTADGSTYTSSFDGTGLTIKAVEAPKLSSVSNAATGVTIKWNAVSGATKYRVFYKTGNGSWTGIANTASTSYTWTGAKSGTKYDFTVRCVDNNGNYVSGFDTVGKSTSYVAAPKISSIANGETGVQISWGKVAGAVNYGVYCKTGSGNWTKVGSTTSTSFNWTGAKSGTTYAFTIRCLTANGTDYASGFDPTGKSIRYVAAPKISTVSNVSSGIQIKWGGVGGAVKYRVYYKTGSGDWIKAGDTTSTSFTWTGAKKGTKYTFTVRCINSSGTGYDSSFDRTGKSITKS